MTLQALLGQVRTALKAAGIDSFDYDARALLERATGRDRLGLILAGNEEVPPEQAELALALSARRAGREPLQYIQGEAWFMGLRFKVTPQVLIPRADTEILCEEAIRRLPTGGRLLDIGTGSGAIALSIACLRPDAQVSATDVSPDALSVARENARSLGVKVSFYEGDCLAPVTGLRYDMIVSNPPYISAEERKLLSPEVLQEPALALFDGGDGLSFYRRIAEGAGSSLVPGGTLLFEIGFAQKDAVLSLLSPMGETFALRDYGQNWRVIGVTLR